MKCSHCGCVYWFEGYSLVLAEEAVSDHGAEERREVAEHVERVVDGGRGAVIVQQRAVQEQHQDS